MFQLISMAVFAVYLLVASNYIAEIFSCKLRHLLSNSMLAKNLTAYFLMLFLVIVVNPEFSKRNPLYVILLSMVVFVWFFMTCRTHLAVTLTILGLLMITYISNLLHNQYNSMEDKDKNTTAIKVTYYLQLATGITAAVITVIGFIMYFIEKKKEYGSDFTFTKFIIGTKDCRGWTPENVKILKKR